MPTIQTTLRMFYFIQWSIAENHESPTIAEIGKEFGMSSTGSVYAHLRKMVARGWIRIIPNVSRGVRIVEQEKTKAA